MLYGWTCAVVIVFCSITHFQTVNLCPHGKTVLKLFFHLVCENNSLIRDSFIPSLWLLIIVI